MSGIFTTSEYRSFARESVCMTHLKPVGKCCRDLQYNPCMSYNFMAVLTNISRPFRSPTCPLRPLMHELFSLISCRQNSWDGRHRRRDENWHSACNTKGRDEDALRKQTLLPSPG